MLISRGVQLLKTVSHRKPVKGALINSNQIRLEWMYREVKHPPARDKILSEICGAVLWWWVLWNLWHDWRVLVEGHLPAPIPEHWTDEELGIPPE
ncbi:PREDICTED: NADH dehydrogenase [ubiquinone] 1 beta subcomplex subunit 2, mitochondrial-like [Dufourea novaeangliae]|uniref:NADH dehydrogenase [ubiquinone] 1 beta subcomplex subunit 2, mitochondrial n=1 Tax=Dufourea novaeangliae TaxID=178035 RepID=A0A154P757_DUFNO|nr:PREDICTED: NADH dehydrogenase [ubiquinone] 1 beta subcomplex subunit 2, mitochondrial-like [Dufourea novaeangliae]KZC07028.1 NADH dehydrogenase [ubiquinone] 1 beta subcomplex subunit 2, mitochondrial [Dufourea novaeangliae]